MKLLIINTSINSTSTGRIAEQIGECAQDNGFDVFAGYGFINNYSRLKTIPIGSKADHYLHTIKTRLTDRHGFGSRAATEKFVREIEEINPDIINIHNIHGYYMNIEILSDYLRSAGKPVIWTFHDCWPITGHCSYFDAVNCMRWKTECYDCPNLRAYPSSRFLDNSTDNFIRKKNLFESIPNLTIVAPCKWMADNVRDSFLNRKNIIVIHNGVDVEVFRPSEPETTEYLRKSLGLSSKRIYLGVASVWDRRKGLDDFVRISEHLSKDEQIVLIGLTDKQKKGLPENITAIKRTENVSQLADFYSMADVFINPTYVDNFPTTNIEALACGTPVVTYKTGGSPEAIDSETGIVIDKGELIQALEAARNLSKSDSGSRCRERALNLFVSRDRFNDYVTLFKEHV